MKDNDPSYLCLKLRIYLPIRAAIADREKNRKSLISGGVSGGGGGRGDGSKSGGGSGGS